MRKKIYGTAASLLTFFCSFSQADSTQPKTDSTKPPAFAISGSVDVFYRYNFADAVDEQGNSFFNNYTSFTNAQNSFELGMASIRADHSFGKASATIDLGFGRRAEEFSYNDGGQGKNGFFSLANIKQAYLSYAISEKVKLTMGKWATHVGYELVDAYLNRNYSMDYMFSYGPFFHTGLKADVALGGTSAFMVGIANPSDFSSMPVPHTAKWALAQFSTGTSNGKLKAYLNYQGGKYAEGSNLNQVDLVVTGTVTDKFSIGYNGTVQSRDPKDGSSNSWWGSALYFNVDPTKNFGFTLRTEYFDDKKGVLGLGSSIFDVTLSGNIRVGNLTIIPELRMDNASEEIFLKGNAEPTKSTFTGLLAATYHF